MSAPNCTRCGRGLKDPASIERGMGPVCAAQQAIAQVADNEQPVLLVGALEDVGLVCGRRPDGRLATNVAQRFVWHSPTGFECGYGGSGPADLALNVLAALVPVGSDGAEGWTIFDKQKVSATAGLLHQDFKDEFIARLPRQGGTVSIADIRAWLDAARQKEHFRERIGPYQLVAA